MLKDATLLREAALSQATRTYARCDRVQALGELGGHFLPRRAHGRPRPSFTFSEVALERRFAQCGHLE